jgi:hypothetical protein
VKTRDAEIDALQTLDAFIEKYGDENQTMAVMRDALIELAARAMLGASGVIFTCDPASDNCPVCAAMALAGRRAHEINSAALPVSWTSLAERTAALDRWRAVIATEVKRSFPAGSPDRPAAKRLDGSAS